MNALLHLARPFCRITLRAFGILCFAISPLGIFLGGMATDSGLRLETIIGAAIIMLILPVSGIILYRLPVFLDRHPAFFPYTAIILAILLAVGIANGMLEVLWDTLGGSVRFMLVDKI